MNQNSRLTENDSLHWSVFEGRLGPAALPGDFGRQLVAYGSFKSAPNSVRHCFASIDGERGNLK